MALGQTSAADMKEDRAVHAYSLGRERSAISSRLHGPVTPFLVPPYCFPRQRLGGEANPGNFVRNLTKL
jgi:hypothetical protein